MDKVSRILWLHTQPEHYFNCMMDDLQRGGKFEYVAAFSNRGKGSYTEVPTPRLAKTIFLRPRAGLENKVPTASGAYHLDWCADLYPLKFDAAIVAGYGIRAHRELIRDCRRRGVPVALFADSNLRSERGDSMKSCAKRFLKRRFLARMIADVNLVLPANRLGAAYWRYYGAPAEKIVVCPYYADYARVEAARGTVRAEVLEKHGLPLVSRYLFSAARLVPVKGLEMMIRAFLEMGLGERGWHYVVAGVGPLEGELKALAGAELGKRIHFVGFQQPGDNLGLMAHADLFVLPSRYEPHGIVIQEALAAGTPVLASDVCGAAYDLVKKGVSGDVFVTGDAGDLREKLAGLIENRERLAAMRGTARGEFERWFAAYSPLDIIDSVARRMVGCE